MNDRIAVLVPCFNEALTIADVVRDFSAALPTAKIYVYDNNSDDDTAAIGRQSGAVVRHEPTQGKGNVVRRMFADVEADIYLMVDGDSTYDAASAPRMVERLIADRLDMVVGRRVAVEGELAYRLGHRWGNRALTWIVARLFGHRFTDIFSGYRVFSRRFVKSYPALASGFEIETDLTVHALELGIPAIEVQTPYRARPAGSVSKLSTLADGFRIGFTILFLLKEVRPFRFFGVIATVLATISLILGYPLLATYVETGLVPRFPTAILATGIMLVAAAAMTSGLILASVARARLESKRLAYLSISPSRDAENARV